MTDSGFITMSTNKKAFQLNANCLLVNSTGYIVYKFDHVEGACTEGAGALNGGWGEALYRGQAEVRALYRNCACGGQIDRQTRLKTLPTPLLWQAVIINCDLQQQMYVLLSTYEKWNLCHGLCLRSLANHIVIIPPSPAQNNQLRTVASNAANLQAYISSAAVAT